MGPTYDCWKTNLPLSTLHSLGTRLEPVAPNFPLYPLSFQLPPCTPSSLPFNHDLAPPVFP
ncbi:hypothetical protein CW304_04275 [Bacillus sp. UFRGS-B20]|nr:hypothetical protein CW304_04275 [Bacillus sp. UFRGS-B20]